MPAHRRLYRPEMYRQLERLARKWKKLSYPRFCIQAENEINPDRTNDPDDNFSIVESVRGFLSPKPLSHPYRQGDLRIFIDSLRRPDLYAIRFLNNQRRIWNEQIENHAVQLYRVFYTIIETHAATRRRQEYQIPMIYDYLQTLRGRESVRQVDTHIHNTIAGLEERSAMVHTCLNTGLVDSEIERVLEENRRIQNGGY